MLEQILITDQNDSFTICDRGTAVDEDLHHYCQSLTRLHGDLDSKLRKAEFSPSPVSEWDHP